MPTPEELEEYLEKTIAEYSHSNPGHAKKWAKEVYTDYLFEGYSQCQKTIQQLIRLFVFAF